MFIYVHFGSGGKEWPSNMLTEPIQTANKKWERKVKTTQKQVYESLFWLKIVAYIQIILEENFRREIKNTNMLQTFIQYKIKD